MLDALKAKRSQLLADQKAIVDLAMKETRALKPEEDTKLKAMSAEGEGLLLTIGAAEANQRAIDADNKLRPAVGRPDVNAPAPIPAKDLKGYSVLRALRLCQEHKPIDGLEAEMSVECSKRYGRTPKGFFIPEEIFRPAQEQRAIITTTTGVGGILTQVSGDYIDALRAQMVMGRLGVTYVGGLQGTFALPRSSGITSYWVTEGNAPTAGAITIDQVVLTNKCVGAYQDVSRTFLNQTSLAVEQLMRDQIVRSVGVAIDQAVARGSGTGGQPLGILNDTNCTYLTLSSGATGQGTTGINNTTGSVMTWANAVSLESAVSGANVMIERGGYLTSAVGLGYMKTATKASNYPAYLAEDGETNGYPVLASNILPTSNGTNTVATPIIFGNWVDAVIGLWGGLDITVDPYALSTSGGLRIIGLQDVDFKMRHPESFARAYDMKYA